MLARNVATTLTVLSLSLVAHVNQSAGVYAAVSATPPPSDKLDPLLVQRMEEVDAEALIPVSIWAAPLPNTPTEDQLWAQAVDLHPTIPPGTKYPDIVDPVLRAEVEAIFTRLLTDACTARVAPLLEALAGMGVKAQATTPTLPMVTAKMKKAQIETIVTSERVAYIYLDDAVSGPADGYAVHHYLPMVRW